MSWTFEKLLVESGIVDYDTVDWRKGVRLAKGVKPFKHQLSGLNLLNAYERCGLYDQTGTGKTLPIQAMAIFRAGQGHKVLCLMPPSLLQQFRDSFFSTFVNVGRFVKIEVLAGTVSQREQLIAKWNLEGLPDIIIMTYHMFRGSGKKAGYDLKLKKAGYNVIIADEAQALRNPSSSIHKKIYNYVGGKKDDLGQYQLILSTGTPSHTHVEQNYGLIRLVTPNLYGTKAAYERLHVVRNMASPFKPIIGYENLDIMVARLYARARRVEKSDVADLPPKIHTVIPVELSKPHKTLYKKLLDERVLQLEGKFIDAVQDQALRQTALKLITNPEEYSDAKITNEMENTLLELISSISLSTTKVIIFIHFNQTAGKLMALLKEHNPALINGSVTNKSAQVDKFLNDDSCRLLIAHPQSAGAGLNLQSVCSDVIFYECPDSSGDLNQAEDRVHRISGTKGTVNVYFLSPTGTWGAKKIVSLQKKDANINRVVGDKTALLHDLFDD